MENETSQKLLTSINNLASDFYHLALYASKDGIKVERSNAFFIVFLRLIKELEQFHRKWQSFKALTLRQGSGFEKATLQSIESIYSYLLHNYYLFLAQATLKSFIEIALPTFQNKKLLNINDLEDLLAKHNWEKIYFYLKKFQNICWDLLPLNELQVIYAVLENQYNGLSSINILSHLRQIRELKSKICQLRYQTIGQNMSELQNLLSPQWPTLSNAFLNVSKQWNAIQSQLQQFDCLHELETVFCKEYNKLSLQYYSLLKLYLKTYYTQNQIEKESTTLHAFCRFEEARGDNVLSSKEELNWLLSCILNKESHLIPLTPSVSYAI